MLVHQLDDARASHGGWGACIGFYAGATHGGWGCPVQSSFDMFAHSLLGWQAIVHYHMYIGMPHLHVRVLQKYCSHSKLAYAHLHVALAHPRASATQDTYIHTHAYTHTPSFTHICKCAHAGNARHSVEGAATPGCVFACMIGAVQGLQRACAFFICVHINYTI